jgi:protein TonB
MLRTVTHAILPQVVNVTFVAAPEPLKAPPPPKTVPLVQPKQSFVPPLPQVNIVQTEPTITLPPPQPRPSEPAPAVAAPVAQATAGAAATGRAEDGIGRGICAHAAAGLPKHLAPHGRDRRSHAARADRRKGTAEQVTVQKSSGSNNLDEAGRQAVLRALFKPHVEDGKAIPVYALVPINFQLG